MRIVQSIEGKTASKLANGSRTWRTQQETNHPGKQVTLPKADSNALEISKDT